MISAFLCFVWLTSVSKSLIDVLVIHKVKVIVATAGQVTINGVVTRLVDHKLVLF